MHIRRNLLRFLALAAGVAFLTAETCAKDNLGNSKPGPTSFRVSIAPDTIVANGASGQATISEDGRFVCFSSVAKNLANPTSAFKEIFVRDRWTDTNENVSKLAGVFDPNTKADCEHPYISPNGQFVVFQSKGELTFDISSGTPENFPGVLNIFRVDRSIPPPNMTRIPPMELDADCSNASISDDGQFVAFQTAATNIPGLPNASGNQQIYVYDTVGSTMSLISHDTGGATTVGNRDSGNARISRNGAFVAFESFAGNLTADPNAAFLRRIYAAAKDGTGVELVSRDSGVAGTPADNHCAHASISGDGRYVAFIYQGGTAITGAPTDPNGFSYLIRRDRDPGSLATSVMGTRAFAFALFISTGITGTTSISDDGQLASYLGVNPGITDLQILIGRLQGAPIAASRHVLAPGSTLEFLPDTAISADGRWVVWDADTSKEVLGDSNAAADVFGYGPIR